MLRMLGDGLIDVSPVSSNQYPRFQFSSAITVRSALILRSSLYNLAISPIVMPWRIGIGM